MLQPSLLLLIWPIPFDHNIPMLVILVDVPNKVAGVVYRAVDSCTKFKNVYKNTFYAHQTSTSICRADKVLYMTLWLYIWGTVLAKRRSCSNKQFPSSKILPTPRLLVSERFCSFDLKCCERIVMRVLSLDSQSLGQKHCDIPSGWIARHVIFLHRHVTILGWKHFKMSKRRRKEKLKNR